MNPDKEELKIHASHLQAGDTWDDVYEDSDVAREALPLRNGDAGLPDTKEKAVPGVNQSADQPIVLPAAQPSKWANVREIDPANDALNSRPAKSAQKLSPVVPDSEQDGKPQKLRHFILGRADWVEWEGKIGKVSVKWMALTGVGVVVIIVLAVFFQNEATDNGIPDNPSLYSKVELEGEQLPLDGSDLGGLGLLANSEQDAKAMFGDFACAKSADEAIHLVYEPERNRETIARNWKPLRMEPGWTPSEGNTWTMLDDNGLNYGVLEGLLANFTGYTAFFRNAPEGLRIDWKATTGYGSASFGDLKQGKGDATEIRAWLSLADLFTYSYPENDFRCFRVVAPDGILNIWGYVPIGGELDQSLLKKFIPGEVSDESEIRIQVTLRLFPGRIGSLPDQWVIAEIVRMSWLDS